MTFASVLSLTLVSFLATAALAPTVSLARGGAIGGGNVNAYPIMTCRASSIDATYTSGTYSVVVMGEADSDGFLLGDSALTVALLDVAGGANAYLPTQTAARDFDSTDLKTFQYGQTLPGEENFMTATFTVTGSEGYLLSTADAHHVEELKLSECEYVTNAQDL